MDRHINKEYLDLLRKTLAYQFWPEPLHPIQTSVDKSLKTCAAKLVDNLLYKFTKLRMCANVEVSTEDGNKGWPLQAHTMVGMKRLENIYRLCNTVMVSKVYGAYVECGVWRGGASMFARACLPFHYPVVLFDSFEGMPPDEIEPDYEHFNFLKVSKEEVEKNFIQFGLFYNLYMIKGFFSQTLPNFAKISPTKDIAILRADGDMYTSTLDILDNLYQYVVPGGYVIIDDYALPFCRSAIDDFRERHKSSCGYIVDIDGTGAYWRKQ